MSTRKKTKRAESRLSQFVKSVWLFPLIVFIVLLSLTAFRINGSSVGTYDTVLYGRPDHTKIAGNPRGIRSDEWLFVTQLTIAQQQANYPRFNQNIGSGRDVSVIGDAPYKEWSTLFRPQNIAFFIIPFEYAFAFKWWLLLALVISSCYFFVLRIFKDKRLFAAVFSTAAGLSPFIFWWYQTATLAPIFYGFFIALVGIRIINREPIPLLKRHPLYFSLGLYALILAYLLVSFALILYPPFQIPIILTVAAFLLGYLLEHRSSKKIFTPLLFKTIAVFAVSALLAIGVIFTFVQTRSGVIDAIQNTVYPGSRKVEGGGLPVVQLFNTYLQPQLQRQSKAAHYYNNQSEASNFILFAPLLVVLGFILLFVDYRRNKRLRWTLLGVQLVVCLFLANLLTPILQPLYNLLLLSMVPHLRLMIGLGFAGVIQLLLISRLVYDIKFSDRKVTIYAAIYSCFALAVVAWAGHTIREQYPLFINNFWLIAGFGLLFTAALFCFISRRALVGAILLLILSAGSVFYVHPLNIGLDPLYKNRLFSTIDSVSKPGDTWITLDDIYIENFIVMSNRDSLSGIQLYPDVSFWRQVNGAQSDYIYNRYAHIFFNSDPAFTDTIKLIQFDTFQIKFQCSDFIKTHADFVLSEHPISYDCTQLVTTVKYPAVTYFIYKIN